MTSDLYSASVALKGGPRGTKETAHGYILLIIIIESIDSISRDERDVP